MNLLNKDQRGVLLSLVLVFFMGLLITNCAPRPENIEPYYLPASVYHGYSCNKLEEEHARITRKVRTLYKKQNQHVYKDVAVVGASVLLFNPTIFLLIGEDERDELSFLKGEYEAMEAYAKENECPIAEVIAKERAEEEASRANNGNILERLRNTTTETGTSTNNSGSNANDASTKISTPESNNRTVRL